MNSLEKSTPLKIVLNFFNQTVEHKSEKPASMAASEKYYLVSAGASFFDFYIQLSCYRIFI